MAHFSTYVRLSIHPKCHSEAERIKTSEVSKMLDQGCGTLLIVFRMRETIW
jgi:hypothetical protein